MNKRPTVAILVFICLCLSALGGEYSESVLVNLKGVGLEVKPLNIKSDNFDLKREDVEAHILEYLKAQEVRLLTDIELDVMPGRPFLETNIDLVHAQGPSHMYSISLELKEMAQLERPRDSVVMVAVTTWEQKSIGIANRSETVYSILDKLLQLFAMEFKEMNSN